MLSGKLLLFKKSKNLFRVQSQRDSNESFTRPDSHKRAPDCVPLYSSAKKAKTAQKGKHNF